MKTPRASMPTRRWAPPAVAAWIALACCAVAVAQLPRSERAELAVLADRTAFEPGSEARIAAIMTIEDGWHTNSHEPTYDYLIPTEVELALPPGWEAAEVRYPPGEMKTFAFADEPLSVFEEEVVMVGRVRVPGHASGMEPVEVTLRYQACDDRSCLPPVSTTATLELEIGAGGEPANQAVFAAQSGPPAAGGDAGAAARPAGSGVTNLALVLLLGVVGGLILNAMPCVLPVLSLKVFGLVKAAGQGRSQVVVGGLATAAGILFSFWGLALAAILARAGGAAVGWGVQFQSPMFVAALTVIVLLFCLNLWGVFEIPLPARLANLAASGQREGVLGHFSSGLFATLMATPCSAPFLGTAVGFALSQPAGIILAVFTAVGLGMALPYLALAAAPGSARLLPKPGPWMGHLKTVMGFLLAGAAIWLLYVLSAQVSPERLAFFQLALLLLAMFVWMRHQAGSAGVRGLARIGVLASLVGSLVLIANAPPRTADVTADTGGRIEWTLFDRQEAERLAAAGSLVFVDVTADWCFTCKVNERLVLETDEVADAFERHAVVPMKADWTNRSDEIAEYLADHGRYGIPFYLLYRPGQAPHLFGELITTDEVIAEVEAAAAQVAARSAL